MQMCFLQIKLLTSCSAHCGRKQNIKTEKPERNLHIKLLTSDCKL